MELRINRVRINRFRPVSLHSCLICYLDVLEVTSHLTSHVKLYFISRALKIPKNWAKLALNQLRIPMSHQQSLVLESLRLMARATYGTHLASWVSCKYSYNKALFILNVCEYISIPLLISFICLLLGTQLFATSQSPMLTVSVNRP